MLTYIRFFTNKDVDDFWFEPGLTSYQRTANIYGLALAQCRQVSWSDAELPDALQIQLAPEDKKWEDWYRSRILAQWPTRQVLAEWLKNTVPFVRVPNRSIACQDDAITWGGDQCRVLGRDNCHITVGDHSIVRVRNDCLVKCGVASQICAWMNCTLIGGWDTKYNGYDGTTFVPDTVGMDGCNAIRVDNVNVLSNIWYQYTKSGWIMCDVKEQPCES